MNTKGIVIGIILCLLFITQAFLLSSLYSGSQGITLPMEEKPGAAQYHIPPIEKDTSQRVQQIASVEEDSLESIPTKEIPTPAILSLSVHPDLRSNGAVLQVSDCSMTFDYPDIAVPGYGVNGPGNSSLLGFSRGRYISTYREISESVDFVNYCYNAPAEPYWIWLIYKAVLVQSGPSPRTYTVTLDAITGNTIIPDTESVETFEPEHQYPYIVYIPIKNSDAEKINSFQLEFSPVDT